MASDIANEKPVKTGLEAEVEEFFNHRHDKSGRFAPTVGGKSGGGESGAGKSGNGKSGSVKSKTSGKSIQQRIDKIGVLGPSSRFRKRDLKTLSDPQLRKLHAHLETNSRKWGAAITALALIAGVGGMAVGLPALGPVTNGVAAAFLTRTRERWAVGSEAQRRGIHLKFSLVEFLEQTAKFSIQGKSAKEQLDALHPDIKKMTPQDIAKALNDGLKAIQELLDDPEEDLSTSEHKALTDSQSYMKKALKQVA